MSTSYRRRQSRIQGRSDRKVQERLLQRYQEAQRSAGDGTAPQVWVGGYVHKECGGEAERMERPYYGAYCCECQHTVPVEETVRA